MSMRCSSPPAFTIFSRSSTFFPHFCRTRAHSYGLPPLHYTHSARRKGFPIWASNDSIKKRPALAATHRGLAETNIVESLPSSVSFILSERAKVVAMVAFALALCNADRVIMSVAIVNLASAHNWSNSFSGIIQSSFLWGYLMSPIAGGALAEQFGGKVVLGCGVAIWSLATLFTPVAATHSLGMLLGIRVIMGLAEGVAMPCMSIMISRWFPVCERARAVGLSMAGFHLGSVAGLLFTPSIIRYYGQSGPFIFFGVLGYLWLLIWASCIYKNPESCTQISTREKLSITQESSNSTASNMKKTKFPPFSLLLSKAPTWAIIVANGMNNWGYFVLLSWMPTYLKTVFSLELKEAVWFSAAPWAMMAATGFFAGSCSDFLIQSGLSITLVRKIMQSIGFLGPAMALLSLNAATTINAAVFWLTVGIGLTAFSQAGFLINYQEIGPSYVGVLQGISNTVGTLAAITSTIGSGCFIQWLGSFQAFLTLTAVMYMMSALFWNVFATGESVFD